MELHEIVAYLIRKIAAFERLLSPPPQPKVKTPPIDAADYGTVKVVHVHHYIHEPEKPKVGYWEHVYRSLLKGF